MNFLSLLSGLGPGKISGLGKVGLRLEFNDNGQLFSYLDANQHLKEFVKVPASKNPNANTTALKNHLENSHISEFSSDAAGVVMVPLNEIFTDHKNFQNRETEFSNESVERILSAIREGTFRWAVFDPIILFRNPADSKLYILSGHSRFAAFKLAAQNGSLVAGRAFDKIPAKIFEGGMEEARELARTSNNLSTRETDQERANYYRDKRENGSGPKQIQEEAKKLEGKNATFILNLSYLSPTGKAWDNLKLIAAGTESENSRTMKEIADWIGDARRKFPDLTSGHENEIFDWLFSGAFTKLKTKKAFQERLGSAIHKATQFGKLDERLNIENRSGKSESELQYDEEVEAARNNYAEAEKILKAKRQEFISRGAEENKIESYLVEYQAAVNNTLRKLNELVKMRDHVKDGAKNQMSLFGLGNIGRQPFFIQLLGGVPESGIIETVNVSGLGALKFPAGSFTFFQNMKLAQSRKVVPNGEINSVEDVFHFFLQYIYKPAELHVSEKLVAIYIGENDQVAGVCKLITGTQDEILLDTKLVFAAALQCGARSIILVRTKTGKKPSKLSSTDLNFLKALEIQAQALDLKIRDYMLISSVGYYSVLEQNPSSAPWLES